jgi:glycosidase
VQNFVTASAVYWLRNFDIDGFRVDAAWGPDQRNPNFWVRWRAALKSVKPDILLVAEAPPYGRFAIPEGFDVAYDWTDSLGVWAWQDAFDHPAGTARRLRAMIEASLAYSAHPVLRFLDNNDTGPRFITRYGAALTREASTMLLTLPGLPALYTGDEVGAAFEPYRAHERLSWSDPNRLRPWYRRLLALRRGVPALNRGRIVFLASPSQNLLAYARVDPRTREAVIVLLNFGSTGVQAGVPRRFRYGDTMNLLTCRRVPFDAARGTIDIPSRKAIVLGSDVRHLCGR